MKFLSIENLMLAYKNALKSRKNKHEVYVRNQNCESNLNQMYEELKSKTYQHGAYHYFSLSDSKKRYIASPSFRDHILHHMIHNICDKVFDKRMVFNSFATRKNKWTHKALHYTVAKLKKLVKNEDKLGYLKIDISKYFYSINHRILKQKIEKHIHNPELLYAINLAIDSYKTSSLFDHLFSEDSPYRKTQEKGLPIWALYSQLFANLYLSDIDRHIVQKIKPQIYIRYMDDFIFIDTIKNLWEIQRKVCEKIEEYNLLVIPKKKQRNTMEHGLWFLGFSIRIENKKVLVQVSKSTKKKYRKCKDIINTLSIEKFSRKEQKRVFSVLQSRKWIFTHTGDAECYLESNS